VPGRIIVFTTKTVVFTKMFVFIFIVCLLTSVTADLDFNFYGFYGHAL
jgi:hypothetical protein